MNEKTNPNESWTLPSAMTYKAPTKTTITRFDVRNIIYCAAWLSVIAMLFLAFLGLVEENLEGGIIIVFVAIVGMFNYPVNISTKKETEINERSNNHQ